MASNNIPHSENQSWGFYGTIAQHADSDAAWPLAMAAIADATGCTPDEVRAFLDSRHGRHFADDVANAMARGSTLTDAIATATAKWMAWRIGPRTARETGIPRGLPYLTGYVINEAIEADAVG